MRRGTVSCPWKECRINSGRTLLLKRVNLTYWSGEQHDLPLLFLHIARQIKSLVRPWPIA